MGMATIRHHVSETSAGTSIARSLTHAVRITSVKSSGQAFFRTSALEWVLRAQPGMVWTHLQQPGSLGECDTWLCLATRHSNGWLRQMGEPGGPSLRVAAEDVNMAVDQEYLREIRLQSHTPATNSCPSVITS
jgi:hypothetical protein